MDNLLTQGLIGLVFVLSIALWSKSSSSTTSTLKEASSSQKNQKKKKKKVNAVSVLSDVPAAPIAIAPSAKVEPPLVTSAEKPLKETNMMDKSTKNDISKGSKKAAGIASKKKMALEDFVAKTNEERVEELEKAARGDAGEKDLGGDMIDKDLQPEKIYKKTARIEPAAYRINYPAISSEEGWESVGGKAKIVQPVVPSVKSNNVVPSNAWASSNPFALLPGSGAEVVRTSTSTSSKSPSTPANSSFASAGAAAQAQTKKQRQNAAKTQAKKAEKEALEAERLDRLAQHKKQVEGERMKDYLKKQPSAVAAPFSIHQNGKSKTSSTLAKASVNEKGSLVWD